MFRSIKLTACAALLAALVTTTAQADLIVVGQIIDEPEFFSTTLQWNPGQGASESYFSPSGANWPIVATVVQVAGLGFLVPLIAQHVVAPHGSPEVAPNLNFFAAVLGTLPGFSLSASTTLDHPAIPGHQDVFSATFEQVGAATAPVWRITISGRHGEEVPAVPDAASTVILLGLGLTALGIMRTTLAFVLYPCVAPSTAQDAVSAVECPLRSINHQLSSINSFDQPSTL